MGQQFFHRLFQNRHADGNLQLGIIILQMGKAPAGPICSSIIRIKRSLNSVIRGYIHQLSSGIVCPVHHGKDLDPTVIGNN